MLASLLQSRSLCLCLSPCLSVCLSVSLSLSIYIYIYIYILEKIERYPTVCKYTNMKNIRKIILLIVNLFTNDKCFGFYINHRQGSLHAMNLLSYI